MARIAVILDDENTILMERGLRTDATEADAVAYAQLMMVAYPELGATGWAIYTAEGLRDRRLREMAV